MSASAIGFNFRNTSGYVTDGADETYVLGNSDPYPTTRAGWTFGWEDTISGSINRDSGNDARLAGINYMTASGVRFRVDLPATGDYTVAVAMGDAASAQEVSWAWKDDTTNLNDFYDGNTSGGNFFYDATETEYTNSTWPGSQTPVQYTFATTIFRIQSHTPVFSNPTLAHVALSQVGGGVNPLLLASNMRGGLPAMTGGLL